MPFNLKITPRLSQCTDPKVFSSKCIKILSSFLNDMKKDSLNRIKYMLKTKSYSSCPSLAALSSESICVCLSTSCCTSAAHTASNS